MQEHGSEQPPDLAVTDFRQSGLPVEDIAPELVLCDGQRLDELILLAEVRQKRYGDADDDQNDGQNADRDGRRVENGPAVDHAGALTGLGLLILLSLLGGGPRGLYKTRIVRVLGEFLERLLGRLDIRVVQNPDLPGAVQIRVHLVLDALGIEKIAETSGLVFVLEAADGSHRSFPQCGHFCVFLFCSSSSTKPAPRMAHGRANMPIPSIAVIAPRILPMAVTG